MTLPIQGGPFLPTPIESSRASELTSRGPAVGELGGDIGGAPVEKPSAGGFGEALVGAFEKASSLEKSADQQAEKFAAGDPDVGIHEVILAAEKANIGVRYAVTLKNRVLEAYRELMQTPL